MIIDYSYVLKLHITNVNASVKEKQNRIVAWQINQTTRGVFRETGDDLCYNCRVMADTISIFFSTNIIMNLSSKYLHYNTYDCN